MRKPLFNKVAIVGVGLIGGSLGLAIKKRKIAKFVVGVVRRKETVREAFERRALDVATLSLAEGVRGADLVILCAPVSTIVKQMKALGRAVSPSAIVIDVGSSKKQIDEAAKKFLKKGRFVGCHPMAGSEKRGVAYADANLFNGSTCFVTVPNKKIDALWKLLGSHPVHMGAAQHDDWVAQASHLPHILAFSLFCDLEVKKARRSGIRELNPSIRGFARLAKSDPELWADIFLTNRQMLLKHLGRFEKTLTGWKRALQSKKAKKLERFISKANINSNHLALEKS